jgi:hypothetical protein
MANYKPLQEAVLKELEWDPKRRPLPASSRITSS